MTEKHTPGPWTCTADMRRLGYYKITEPYEFRALETEANARLIAAAPDMLEALQNLVKHKDQNAWNEARHAIAKATGGNNENI